MPGGLINIVAYGAQDLYLTGTPEITYFKIVYRRHTNFSMESIEVTFEDDFGFDKESNLVIPPIADLIHKMYLKIKLPEVILTGRKHNSSLEKKVLDETKANLIIVQKFMRLNTIAYRKALEQYKVDNVTSATDMINVILEVFNTTILMGLSNDVLGDSKKSVIINNFHNIIGLNKFDPQDIDLQIIAEQSIGTIYEDDKELFLTLIENAIYNSEILYNNFDKQYVDAIIKYEDASSKIYKFAWVKKLGHSMINYIEIFIGGERIDKHYGEWIDIWYELSGNKYMSKTYDKLIGNRENLTTFDRLPKYGYTLFIPMQFWFCKYNGLALPLVAMQYSDVSIKLKIRKIQECCYIDEEIKDIAIQDMFDNNDEIIDTNTGDQNLFSLGLKGSLFIDYVYLDAPERRKFAQVAHEYLIEQIEIQEEVHTENLIRMVLDFNYSSKEIIWIAQKYSHIENIDQHTEAMWWNYGINLDGSENPILTSRMEFNGYVIIPEETGNFFNYLQPYVRHRNTPSDGINIYSFSFRPEEQQPTGSCNFTRITQSRLYLRLNPKVYDIINRKTGEIENKRDTVFIKIFSLRLNVLRIIGGYGALGFA